MIAVATISFTHVIGLGTIIAPAFTALSTVFLTWWLKRIDRKAERAVSLSTPTGNGFARAVLDRLEEIGTRLTDLETEVRHYHEEEGDDTP